MKKTKMVHYKGHIKKAALYSEGFPGVLELMYDRAMREAYPRFAATKLILWWKQLMKSHGCRSRFAESALKEIYGHDPDEQRIMEGGV